MPYHQAQFAGILRLRMLTPTEEALTIIRCALHGLDREGAVWTTAGQFFWESMAFTGNMVAD